MMSKLFDTNVVASSIPINCIRLATVVSPAVKVVLSPGSVVKANVARNESYIIKKI